MTTIKSPLQVKNLREAVLWWSKLKLSQITGPMESFTRGEHARTDSKTVANFPAWCARQPSLKSQGLWLSSDGCPRTTKCKAGYTAMDVAFYLFGDEMLWSPEDLAERFPNHPADVGFSGTRHAVVLNRLTWALARPEVYIWAPTP